MTMDRRAVTFGIAACLSTPAIIGRASAQTAAKASSPDIRVTYFDTPGIKGSRDVTSHADGRRIWICGQRNGTLGLLDPADGAMKVINLGENAAPHGVITGPDKAAWVTEGGQNAIARVDADSLKVELFRLPAARANANLNTGVFDLKGILWFTGQNGIIGRFDPQTARMDVWDAPGGRGAYGITRTPKGEIWYVSLAANHLARIDTETAKVTVVEPPTPGQGARRVWSDSTGKLWISEWNSGQLSMHDPATGEWKAWKLPGDKPRAYSVYVDSADMVWVTDFGANAIARFEPKTGTFRVFPSDRSGANVRQMDGRPGEAWGGESGQNRVIRLASIKAS
jgi:virginiamycin B lyase